jgi:uncharacterized membrane protein
MSSSIFILLQSTILAYAVVGGVFLAFSDFIMRSLSHTSGVGGVEAMQVINREVFRWVFMTLFLGMAAVSVFVVIYSAMNISGGPGMLILIAALLYLVGCFAVTVFFNVPMNEALAGMDVSDPATRDYWTRTYLPRWTTWNTVRTVACVAASGMMLFGLAWLTQVQARFA